MKKIDITKATQPLADYATAAQSEPLVVTRRGKPFAAIVPIDGIDMESLSLSTNPDFIALIERSRNRLAKEGGIPVAEVRRQLGLPLKKTAKRKPASNGKRARRAS